DHELARTQHPFLVNAVGVAGGQQGVENIRLRGRRVREVTLGPRKHVRVRPERIGAVDDAGLVQHVRVVAIRKLVEIVGQWAIGKSGPARLLMGYGREVFPLLSIYLPTRMLARIFPLTPPTKEYPKAESTRSTKFNIGPVPWAMLGVSSATNPKGLPGRRR